MKRERDRPLAQQQQGDSNNSAVAASESSSSSPKRIRSTSSNNNNTNLIGSPMDTLKHKLIIFDTSLRDGEQSPGVTLTADEKVEIARQLSRLGVDVCEAGFPIASIGDFEAVERIAKEVGSLTSNRKSGNPMVIAGLARAVPADIARAYEAVKHAPLHRIHTFLATSDIHLKYKLRINREECITRATAAVAYAKTLGCNDIEFSPEDAGRSDREFLCEVLGSVIEAGATTLNIPDTVGYNTPEEYGQLIKHLVTHTPGAEKVIWSTHCHNDLGLATANTLSGIINGARQVEVTINGIGERAGNTSLEEIVMAIHTHPTTFPVYHTIDTQQIYITSQLVTKRTGMIIQPNKAIVGANAFAHESGIHQDGVLKHKATYEIIQPETIGLPSNSLVLGKHSGRAAFRARVEQMLGDSVHAERLAANPQAFEALFASFKKLADAKKSGVTEQDIYALLDDQLNLDATVREVYKLKSVQVVSGTGVLATAAVTLWDYTHAPQNTPTAAAVATNGTPTPTSATLGGGMSTPLATSPMFTAEDGVTKGSSSSSSTSLAASLAAAAAANQPPTGVIERVDAAIGHGPVHAIFSAINRLIGIRNILASYEVKAVTQGSDSLGKVVVRIHEDVAAVQQEDGAGEVQSSPALSVDGLGIMRAPRHAAGLLDRGNGGGGLIGASNNGGNAVEKELANGQGVDEDILVASAKAYVNAVNRLVEAKRRKRQYAGVRVQGVEDVPVSRKVDV